MKNIRGITLIALVVTIIVLLIFAGVTITTITGENGILNRANIARQKNDQAIEDENKKLEQYEKFLSGKTRGGEYESTKILNFKPQLKAKTYSWIEVQSTVDNASVFVWILDGKVKAATNENTYKYTQLNEEQNYIIKVLAIDDEAKIKYSDELSVETSKNDGKLYENGKFYKDFTFDQRTSYTGCQPTYDSDKLVLDASGNGGAGGVCIQMDLTNYVSLKATGVVTEKPYSDASGLELAITTSNKWGSSYRPESYKKITNYIESLNTEHTVELDVSDLTGTYYIWVGFHQSNGYVNKIWLEK